jgi:hypothetical protein
MGFSIPIRALAEGCRFSQAELSAAYERIDELVAAVVSTRDYLLSLSWSEDEKWNEMLCRLDDLANPNPVI